MKNFINTFLIFALVICISFASCKKWIEVDSPSNAVTSQNIFENDQTASSVLLKLYYNLSLQNREFLGLNLGGIAFFTGLTSDELEIFSGVDDRFSLIYKNSLTPLTTVDMFSTSYQNIFICNSAIEGLEKSTGLTPNLKRQLLGEAKFIRAFYYFYLTNIYGDVPLALTTDYKANSVLPKMSKINVYNQVISDLTSAKDLMSLEFRDGSGMKATEERTRPSKSAAIALLARVYLYKASSGEAASWLLAEQESSILIENSPQFNLNNVALDDVFLKNSKETIWALQPVQTGALANTGEGASFVLSAEPNIYYQPVYLSDDQVNSFEVGDLRKAKWVGTSTLSLGGTYNFSNKYKVGNQDSPTLEYSVVLRLAEQYLIRAEARAQLGNIAGAASDINVIRSRARSLPTINIPNPLPEISTSISKSEMLKVILHERQTELFTEWGHRWLDLVRTNEVNSLMPRVSMHKGGQWEAFKMLYPYPQSVLDGNPSLVGQQNQGY